jgi:hypothetical protein
VRVAGRRFVLRKAGVRLVPPEAQGPVDLHVTANARAARGAPRPRAPRALASAAMGRRSRKRALTAPVAAAPRAPRPHATARTHRAPMAEAPRAPWSPYRLVVLPLYLATALSQLVLLATGAALCATGFAALRPAFQSRTGGIGFRA